MSRNMIKASRSFFKLVEAMIVLFLIVIVIYTALLIIFTLYPNLKGDQAAIHTSSNLPAFSYQPLAPIPGVTDAFINNQSTTGSDSGQAVKDLIGKVFKFGVGLCSALAVIMIIYGGFLYVMGAASESNISKGREVIQGAITGLVLVLCIVIILKAVNNSLLSGDLFDDLRVVTIDISTLRVTITETNYPYLPTSPLYGLNSYGDPTKVPDGTQIYNGKNCRIDTDGINPPPFADPRTADGRPGHQNRTSLPGLDANVDPYVVVPNNTIPLGTKVLVTDKTTNKSIVAVVGDHGDGNSAGEISLAAAQAVGAWHTGLGNACETSHDISIVAYKGG